MLRRVARLLRVLLLVAGILLLTWIPMSFFAESSMWFHNWPTDHHGVAFVRNGYLCIMLGFPETPLFPLLEPFSATPSSVPTSSEPGARLGAGVKRIDFRNVRPVYKLLPSLERGTAGIDATIPLWLLAVSCLAWPMASLAVNRRRRNRGFSIEAGRNRRAGHEPE